MMILLFSKLQAESGVNALFSWPLGLYYNNFLIVKILLRQPDSV